MLWSSQSPAKDANFSRIIRTAAFSSSGVYSELTPRLIATSGGEAGADGSPPQADSAASKSADAVEEDRLRSELEGSKMAVPAPTLTAQLSDVVSGGSKAGGAVPDSATAANGDNGMPGAVYENDAWEAPESGSVYTAGSLPGYDAARAALDSGDYRAVCLFYDRLPEGISTQSWQSKIPEDGEKARWELSAEALQALETGAEWDEFYYGDLDSGLGLVIVVAGEEE